MLEAVGKELKVCRIRNGLTLKEVAKNMEISMETLRRYEKDSNGLSIEKLERLLSYYNVDRTIFFDNVSAYMHDKEE